MSNVIAFNNQLKSLIEELIFIFPDDKKLIVFEQKFNLLKSMNKNIIIQYFFEYVYPCKTEIMNKDDSYFNESDGENNINDFFEKNDSIKDNEYAPLSYILTLHKKWNLLNDDNKEVVWKYLQVLVILTERWALSKLNK